MKTFLVIQVIQLLNTLKLQIREKKQQYKKRIEIKKR